VNLKEINQVYFVGIGGIGMSALARYFVGLGKMVAGYDRSSSPLTQELESLGMAIHYTDDVSLIPASFDPKHTLVIWTPAIPKEHTELNYFIANHFTIKKRAEVLGIITKDTYCFAVAGTHGKTTTSSILGHLLFEAGLDVTAFLGGIVENYQSNLIGNGKTVTVVEADEFDRSFLHLHPNKACITSMDADHLDIYGDSAHIEASFHDFAAKIEDPNDLFFPAQLPLKGQTLALDSAADYTAKNIRINKHHYEFEVFQQNELIGSFEFGLPGHHNIMNALTAIAMAHSYGVAVEKLQVALKSFKGVQRRFSYQIQTDSLVYIDDYAHHPTEIAAVHQAVRELYPNQRIMAIFQPHLFSRTRDFMDGFAAELSNFDEVLLLPIYPARELPMPGIVSEVVLEKMTQANAKMADKGTLISLILESEATVFVTIGAGDIGEEVGKIKAALLAKNK